jgi:hypothetical protein
VRIPAKPITDSGQADHLREPTPVGPASRTFWWLCTQRQEARSSTTALDRPRACESSMSSMQACCLSLAFCYDAPRPPEVLQQAWNSAGPRDQERTKSAGRVRTRVDAKRDGFDSRRLTEEPTALQVSPLLTRSSGAP